MSTKRKLKPGEFFCTKCSSIHRETSKLGKNHLQHKGEPQEPVAETTSDVCPKCGDKGFIEHDGGLVQEKCDCGAISREERIQAIPAGAVPPENRPPRSTLKCSKCQDEGRIVLGEGHNKEGKPYPIHRFCDCGQETHDERIGIIPRRGHLGPAQPITEDEAAERDHRLRSAEPYRSGGGEDTG